MIFVNIPASKTIYVESRFDWYLLELLVNFYVSSPGVLIIREILGVKPDS